MFPEIEVGATGDKASMRQGFLELLEAIPHAMKMDFVLYISWASQATWTRRRTPGSKLSRFSDLYPDHLLLAFESVYVATPHADTRGKNWQQVIRDKTAMLLGKLVDKVLEHKKF